MYILQKCMMCFSLVELDDLSLYFLHINSGYDLLLLIYDNECANHFCVRFDS